MEGFKLGVKEGVLDGFKDGLEEGFLLGAKEGVPDGFTEGLADGVLLGAKEGEALGLSLVGLAEGCAVLPVGAGVGVPVGGVVGGDVVTGSKHTGGSSLDPVYTAPSHDTGQASLTVFPPPKPIAGSQYVVFLLRFVAGSLLPESQAQF